MAKSSKRKLSKTKKSASRPLSLGVSLDFTDTPGSVHSSVGAPPSNLRALVCQACSVPKSFPDTSPVAAARPNDPDPLAALMGLTMTFGRFNHDVLWMNRLWGIAKVKKWGEFHDWVRRCYGYYHA